MNKLFKLSLAGAIALAGIVACNSKTEVVNNPNYNPETKEVTTQFVLSVNTGGPQTKMSATSVQRASNFLGIKDAHVIAFTTGISDPADDSKEAFVSNPAAELTRDYYLGTLFSSGSIDAANNASESSNRVVQLSVPVNVDAMIFYGKAIRSNAASNSEVGKLDFHIANAPKDTHFDLASRLEDQTSYDKTSALMAFVINRIIGSNVTAMTGESLPYTAVGDKDVPKTEYTMLPELSWQELGAAYDNPVARAALSPLEEILGNAYSTFTKIEINEYRAGYSAAVQNMMTSLLGIAQSVQNANPTSDAEANACRLADEILWRGTQYFTNTMQYKSVQDIKSIVVANGFDGITNDSEWNARFANAEDLNSFPHGNFNIPDGAAQLKYDSDTHKFSYIDPNYALVNPGALFNPNYYLYPAELAYYVNSPLRATSKDISSSDYPNGVNTWDDDSTSGNKWSLGSWNKNARVQSNSRSVAIRNNINYGVALLESKVAIKAGVTYLQDNKAAKTGDASNNQIPANNSKITLQGVLIGGQINTVDWEFLPIVSSGNEFNYVVYDDDIANSAIPTPAGGENYTLVLDNYNRTLGASEQSAVKVALEFKNEGDAFWGRDNIIPKDGIFYLIAELPVATATSASVTGLPVWQDESKYAIPPIYGVNGNDVEVSPAGTVGHSKQINRVFIQNYVTSATFTLNATSLQHAYVSIPNLASSQMSLGLSVDLKWHTGFTYNIEL